MDSFQNPVQPPDPYERYKIEPVGSEKEKSKRDFSGGPNEPNGKWVVTAYFLKTLHKLLSFYERKEKGKVIGEHPVLTQFKEALEILKKEDRSQDTQFLHDLSLLWLQIIEDLSLSRACKPLLKKIHNYPKGQAFSLGYYLTEYAGQQWVPFPYMEIIRQMHKEHENCPQGSSLSEWTKLLDHL